MPRRIGRCLPLTAVVAALALAGCPPGSIVGQPCAEAGLEQCEGDLLARCDGRFFIKLADCATPCMETRDTVTVHETDIATSETWTCADGPHQVERLLVIQPDATLTIEAGALIRMQQASRISMATGGRVDVLGTPEAPILMTSLTDIIGDYGAGTEGGLNVLASVGGEPSVVRHMIIEHGRHGLGVFGLDDTATPPTVENNTLRDNEGFGILLTCNGAPELPDFVAAGNQFFGNQGGDVSPCNP